MRVLFLYPRTLDANHSVGGVAEFLCSLTPALKAHDIDPVIYAGDKTTRQLTMPSQVLADATVYNGPFIKPGWWVSSHQLAPVLEVCRIKNIEVIHAQGTYTAGFMAWQIHKRTKIPYVVTSHSDILTTNSKRMNRANVQRRCRQVLKYAAAVTHLTPMMEAVSHQLYATREKSTVIGNGINCQVWSPYTKLAEQDYMLGIGRLERGKGFNILIDMYANLVARGVTTPLIIAGKGTAEQALIQQAKQTGLNVITDFSDFISIPNSIPNSIPKKSIIFCGYVRDDAKMRLIAESKLILFATQPQLWEEAFGIVQLEAMAAAKPIIASDTNVTRFLEKCGMQCCIVEPENVNAWADQAEGLLGDAERRKQMGQANMQAAARFDWQPIAGQYRDVYARAAWASM